MNKEEMLKKWEKDIMYPTLNHTISALEEQLQCHIEQIIQKVCKEIEILFDSITQQQQKIAYITFHLMRKDILDNVYQYRLFIYDKSWYLKKGQEIGTLDSSFIYDYYDTFLKEVLLKSNAYRCVFSIPELEMFAMRQLKIFHYHFVEVLRYAMNYITESEAYYKLKKEQHIEIQSGAYYEHCDKLYQEETEKDYGKWRRQFLKQENKQFRFADLKGINLKGIDARDVNLEYADVRKSDLQSIQLENSSLQGIRLQKTNLQGANLQKTILNYACFEYADLQQVCFDEAFTILSNVLTLKIHFPYHYVSFRNCCLKNASFKRVVLCYADFRQADITGVDFTDAFLEQCMFTKEQLKQITLTSEQKRQINICNV